MFGAVRMNLTTRCQTLRKQVRMAMATTDEFKIVRFD